MTADSAKDWVDWHREYDEPESRLSRRLRVVQEHIRRALDDCSGEVRVVSMCAGQGRDIIGALRDHPKRAEVEATLIELDERNVAIARKAARSAGLDRVRVTHGDAALSDTYAYAVPAEIVLACGVFGNITQDDIRRTIDHLPMFCAPKATVVWTRYRRADADLTPEIRQWFEQSGFSERTLDASPDTTFGVGSQRLTGEPRPLELGVRMFAFVR